MVKFLIRYLYLLAVWVSAVLLDGDWYVCLMTNRSNSSHTGLPCKETLTYEETLIKADYKNASLVSINTQQSNKLSGLLYKL